MENLGDNIEKMADKLINISTIEDPVERNLAKINQIQVNNLAGLTFESGLRSLLRQDPDVILVGETRDEQTAAIAVSAAITGHLVMSTIHTNDAVSTIVRLIDMGIESYMIANSLAGVVAQRLVKKICTHCKYEKEPTEIEKNLVPGLKTLYEGRGCHNCNDTGYKGRIAVHEILEIVIAPARHDGVVGADLQFELQEANHGGGHLPLVDEAHRHGGEALLEAITHLVHQAEVELV